MNYKVIDRDTYYRKGVFRHFSEDCKCSISMTHQIDVTELKEFSKRTNTKFYINFLYALSKAMNSREDYRMSYLYQTDELIVYDRINPTQYIFHEDTETCTPVYTNYDENYETFYQNCVADIEAAKQTMDIFWQKLFWSCKQKWICCPVNETDETFVKNAEFVFLVKMPCCKILCPMIA